MMSDTTEFCDRIYALVKLLSQEVDNCPSSIKEEARKVYRICKGVEGIVSDLQPYATPGPLLWFALGQVESVLVEIRQVLLDLYRCGSISGFMLAEQSLFRFKGSCTQLHTAIELFLTPELAVPSETQDRVRASMAVLVKVEFSLKPPHQQVLNAFRESGDALNGPFMEMQKACVEMLKMINQPCMMTKEAYALTVLDLQQEINCCAGSKDSAFHLRMMLDVIRIHHGHHDIPLEFLCPLSLSIMRDPVLLHETGNTYEREEIERWWQTGHKFCPRTGIVLESTRIPGTLHWKLHLSPNTNLLEAIARWRLHHEHQLSTRPVLETLNFLSHVSSGESPLCDGVDGPTNALLARSGRLNSASQENLDSGCAANHKHQQRASQLTAKEKQLLLQMQQKQEMQDKLQKQAQPLQPQLQQQQQLLGGKLPVGGGTGLLNNGILTISQMNASRTTSAKTLTPNGVVGRIPLSRDSKGSVSQGAKASAMSAISLAMAAGKQPPSTGPSLTSSAAAIATIAMNAANTKNARISAQSGNRPLGSIFFDPSPPAYGNGLRESFTAKQQQQQRQITSDLSKSAKDDHGDDGGVGRTDLLSSSAGQASVSEGGAAAVCEEIQSNLNRQSSLPAATSHMGTAESWQRQFGGRTVAAAAAAAALPGSVSAAAAAAAAATATAAAAAAGQDPEDICGPSGPELSNVDCSASAESPMSSETQVSVHKAMLMAATDDLLSGKGGGGAGEGKFTSNTEAAAQSVYGVGIGFPLSVTATKMVNSFEMTNAESTAAAEFYTGGTRASFPAEGNEFEFGSSLQSSSICLGAGATSSSKSTAVITAADFAG